MLQLVTYIMSCSFGAIATYLLEKSGVSFIVASCVIGLVGAVISHTFSINDIAPLVFMGTFIGMTQANVAKLEHIIVASIIACLIFLFTKDSFAGYGGKLGAIGFSTVVVTVALFGLLKW